ncbi:MAG: ABC transporter substrate-binding protein [Gammaproteobacteria bacterium]|nr:ABC transporter substrate-binding protein [Gammaproteobacteria bacterium]
MLICSASAAQSKLELDIIYLERQEQPITPLSLLDMPIDDDGLPGSMLGLSDTQTTGSFLNQFYNLEHVTVDESSDLVDIYRDLIASGYRLFITSLNVQDIQSIADIEEDVLIFNISARDDILRNEACHSSVFHFPPSRAMVADALAQYLAWKRWTKLVLVTGRHAGDRAYARALKRAAKRFGLKIIQEKNWTAVAGARRTDSGHHSLQQEVPVFTQLKDYDVLLVADEQDEFGEYFSYRTTRPRPVAGTQGLRPTSWHRTHEQWGATQIQRRFLRAAGRPMTERDYAAWAAVRTFGEAVINTGSDEPGVLREYILSARFKLAGFKGVPLTFRGWNGQLRQPVLVVAPRMLVTVSPQKGFLHERSELDTLGFDKAESACQGF